MFTTLPEQRSDSEQSEKSSSCSEHLQDVDFTRKSRWTDFELEVEGKSLYVPKSHLAMVSPVLWMMFKSDFKEKDADVLPLPDKKYEDVLTFLKCTHPGDLIKVAYNMVPKVLPLAHEYQVKWLLNDCTIVMMSELDVSRCPNGVTAEIVRKYCRICIMAEKYDLKSVISKFIQRVSSVGYRIYQDLTEFKQVSLEVRYSIVCGRLGSIDNKM
ncbi:hypothetical protein ACJMK2_028235 [Sinanodonta woodiana]|uniref:BTB domain-containing protein n=1 Tax=Sinanodonta woodiana TaxID=1069815 RepID=A0ABD3XA27_SINWO